MPYGYEIEYDVSLAKIGEGVGRNRYGAFATKGDAERWLADQGWMTGKRPEVKRSVVPEHGHLATWNRKD